jgi:hypothetical protein
MPGSIPGTWDTANQTHQKSLPSSLFGIVTMNPPVQQIYPLKKLMYLKKITALMELNFRQRHK